MILECRPLKPEDSGLVLHHVVFLGRSQPSLSLGSFFGHIKFWTRLEFVQLCYSESQNLQAQRGHREVEQSRPFIPWKQLLGKSYRIKCLYSGDDYDFDLLLNNGLKITRLDSIILSCSEFLTLSFEQILGIRVLLSHDIMA